MSVRIVRSMEWARPVAPVRREVAEATLEFDTGKPPVLFVPGFGHGAWVFAEHWLEHAASRGFPAYALSLRGQGESQAAPKATLREYVHDVVQVAASLPRQAVLVGHGAGALVVTHAFARYPARAGVLLAPVLDGWATFNTALRRNPVGTLPALVGAPVRLSRHQLFSRELPEANARDYANRVGRVRRRTQWQLMRRHKLESAVGTPPVLVVGSPDDRMVSSGALNRAARRYGAAPLLFPKMGHDLMLEPRWREPVDAILDWLDKDVAPERPPV